MSETKLTKNQEQALVAVWDRVEATSQFTLTDMREVCTIFDDGRKVFKVSSPRTGYYLTIDWIEKVRDNHIDRYPGDRPTAIEDLTEVKEN